MYINSLFSGPNAACSNLPYILTGYMPGAPAPRLGIDAANSGRSPYSFPLTGGGAALAWSYTTGGPILASAAIDAADNVYVVSNDKYLYAFNGSMAVGVSGASRLLWKMYTGPNFCSGACAMSTPTLGNNNYLYVGGGYGLMALDLNTAAGATPPQIVFIFNDTGALGTVYSSVALDTSAASAPTAGRCYFGGSSGFVYALDCRTGLVAWRYQTRTGANTTGVYSMPLHTSLAGGLVIVASENSYVRGLFSLNGTVKWSFVAGSAIRASPVFDAATAALYISAFNGVTYKLNALTGALIWTAAAVSSGCGVQIEAGGALSASGDNHNVHFRVATS